MIALILKSTVVVISLKIVVIYNVTLEGRYFQNDYRHQICFKRASLCVVRSSREIFLKCSNEVG